MRNHFVIVALLVVGCGSDSTALDKADCAGWPLVADGSTCEAACADNAAVGSAHDLGMCEASTAGDPNLDDSDMHGFGCGYSFEFGGEIGCCVPAVSKFSDVKVAFAACQ